MPKARPPFDVERYTTLKQQGMSQRQIAKAMGMPEGTLRNNLKVLGITVDAGTPRDTKEPLGTPGASPSTSTHVDTGIPAYEAPRGTESLLGALAPGDLADLQDLLTWWRQRQSGAPQGQLVRHTFHVDARWLEAIRREADLTRESYAAVLNRALAQYFTRGT
jgi:hypothetical protein